MAKKVVTKSVSVTQIEGVIQIVRGQRVLLDSDLAELYGVPTKRLNEQVARNVDRFPDDFAFQLTEQEVANLKSQIATSSLAHGGRRKVPRVFTEHGVAMLSSVLRSPMAVKVNIEIMRAFVRLRRLLATPGELVAQINQLAETVKLHDDQIQAICRCPQADDGAASADGAEAADRLWGGRVNVRRTTKLEEDPLTLTAC